MATRNGENDKITREELRDVAAARSKVYGFLATVYLQTPTEALINTIKSNSIINSLEKFMSPEEPSEDFKKALEAINQFHLEAEQTTSAQLLEKLLIDRTRLLRGISEAYGPPPPYGSVYLEKMLSGFTTRQVADTYSQAGLAVSKDAGENPDYIGVELDFMRALCEDESKEWAKDGGQAIERLRTERSFLNNHLQKWVPKFCDNMVVWSRSSLYRAIGYLTKGWIILENSQMEELLKAAEEILS